MIETWAGIILSVTALICVIYLILTQQEQKYENPFIFHIPNKNEQKRKLIRKGGDTTRVLLRKNKDSDKLIDGWVVDRHQEGLGIMIYGFYTDIKAESIWEIKAKNAPAIYNWCQIDIRHVNKHADFIFVGCKFVKEINTAILMSFY
jgi:hypothetical protein